jgi:hypothetical protein
VAALNVSLGLLRPAVYRLRYGSTNGMRNFSGIPVLGTLFAIAAGVLGFGDPLTTVVGMAALACDIGGLPWFLVFTWSDRSLWDD